MGRGNVWAGEREGVAERAAATRTISALCDGRWVVGSVWRGWSGAGAWGRERWGQMGERGHIGAGRGGVMWSADSMGGRRVLNDAVLEGGGR